MLPSLRPRMTGYAFLENASRLPFGSTMLGLDPFSRKALGLRYRRREGLEVPAIEAFFPALEFTPGTADSVGRILGDRQWPDRG